MRVLSSRWRGVLACALGLLAACAGDGDSAGGAPEGADSGGAGAADPTTASGGTTSPGSGGSSGVGGSGGSPMDAGQVDASATEGGIDAGAFDAGSITPSSGGTITFQEIGASGWYPSRRDPASGECDAIDTDACCMTRHELASDQLAPWSEELIMTLRGPIVVSQLAVYQPFWPSSGDWKRVAMFDARGGAGQGTREGLSFDGDATAGTPFAGLVGNQCLVDVASDQVFECGPGSVPYCPPSNEPKHYGWQESKLFVMLLSMPHASDGTIPAVQHCGNDTADNWYDAPWIGFSHGELVRSGKFGDCHCYAKDPAEWYLGDGCGQLNAFEVVNDNNDAMNLDVFSTNFFGYQGYIGEGPCGGQCEVGALANRVDLIDKATSQEAAAGAIATPSGGPGAAFVRPTREPRYFIVLFEQGSRSVQLAIISPARIPDAASAVLPAIPERLTMADIGALLDLRLPE